MSEEGDPRAETENEEKVTAAVDDTDEYIEEGVQEELKEEEEEEEEEKQQQEEEPAEDPEVTALKEQIAKMEKVLKEVRQKVADVSDRADDFTKTGYARKVAEMENMRRARSVRSYGS